MNSRAQIVLPAEVYDKLQIECELSGGIGHDRIFEYENGECPVCLWGHIMAAGLVQDCFNAMQATVVPSEFLDDSLVKICPIGGRNSDVAVRTMLNEDYDGLGRVSWQQFCEHFNIVRGEDEHASTVKQLEESNAA